MLRFYLDEDSMDHDLVRSLRARGVDVVSALDVGMIARDDEAHLQWAAAHGRVLFSFNVGDFYHLHTAFLSDGRSHSGIVLARQQRLAIGEVLRRLLRLSAMKSADEMRNTVEFLGAWG